MSPELPDYSRSRAILIGTSTYQDPLFPPLPAVANSLRGLQDVLTDPGLCGWPTDRTTVLEDPTDVRRLTQTLRRLVRDTEDVLFVYFAGHGTIVRRGQLCLVVADTDASDPDITGLEFERVREALLDSPAQTKIVILDCCYSGRAIETMSGADAVADGTDTRGVYTLTASDHTAHVVALDEQAGAYTSFTGELLDLVRAGIANGPPRLPLNLVYLHLRRRLQQRRLPAPNQRGTDTADRYAFTRNAALPVLPEPVSQEQAPPSAPKPTSAAAALARHETEHRPELPDVMQVPKSQDAASAIVSGQRPLAGLDVRPALRRTVWATVRNLTPQAFVGGIVSTGVGVAVFPGINELFSIGLFFGIGAGILRGGRTFGTGADEHRPRPSHWKIRFIQIVSNTIGFAIVGLTIAALIGLVLIGTGIVDGIVLSGSHAFAGGHGHGIRLPGVVGVIFGGTVESSGNFSVAGGGTRGICGGIVIFVGVVTTAIIATVHGLRATTSNTESHQSRPPTERDVEGRLEQ